jgi:rhodanese-related sulfurtransferase
MSAGAAAHFWNQGYQNVRVVVGGLDMLIRVGFKMWYPNN